MNVVRTIGNRKKVIETNLADLKVDIDGVKIAMGVSSHKS